MTIRKYTLLAIASIALSACRDVNIEANNKPIAKAITQTAEIEPKQKPSLFQYDETVTYSPTALPVWKAGPPGFEGKQTIPESAQDWWVRDIHNPTLNAFLPIKRQSRAAVIVVPGGGHENLVFNSEGQRPARFLNQWGVSAFALKYRLARQDGSPYDIEDHAGEDLRRAVKWLRAHAEDYDIDPNQIGVLGFSAGGELVNFITYDPRAGIANAQDPIERHGDHADFTMQIYPGPIGIPQTYTGPLPPSFFVTANDDPQPARSVIDHYKLYQDNNTPIELHVFAQGGHAFNMGTRSELKTISDWPNRLKHWMIDQGYITIVQ
ncbi:MAG: alpha/beta hydrolase [Maricaulaceae bacterium]